MQMKGSSFPSMGQPKLGGNDDLRSFARYRYYDDNYLIVNVEHRWYAFTALDVALFADAGTVAAERADVDFSDMRYSGGMWFSRPDAEHRGDAHRLRIRKRGGALHVDVQRHLQAKAVRTIGTIAMRKTTNRAKIGSLEWALLALVILAAPAAAQKFYPDDPLEKEPAPVATYDPGFRDLSEIMEFVNNIFGDPGERHPDVGVIPAGGVNTLGGVPDSPWYVNRHAKTRMTREELLRGPGDDNPPSRDSKWQALIVKSHGLRPGILIRDAENELYLLRFDPVGYLELANGATMVSSRTFYALGYYVPEKLHRLFPIELSSRLQRPVRISPAWVRRGTSRRRTSTTS